VQNLARQLLDPFSESPDPGQSRERRFPMRPARACIAPWLVVANCAPNIRFARTDGASGH
jgi:hypothetical protein